MASSNFLGKIRLISFFILVFAGVLIAKLFFVQVIHSTSYSERADRQYITPMGNLFERNNIYFKKRDGTLVSAATIISGFKIAINPVKIIDPEDTYQKISQIIPLEKEEFLIKVNKKDDPYEEIINKTTKEIADKIDALKIPGISVYKENWRSYPAGNMASNTIGFVAFKENDFSGRYGLERYYNDVLSRQNNNLYTNFFAEIFSKINYSVFKSGEKEGDIVTTIEPTVQNELEQVLQKGVMEKWNSDSVAGLIINPLDGSIYAMANLPNFDPNDFSQVKDAKTFANPFVENVFEFGSIIKSLTMASGLDAGVVTPETEYDDKGFVIVNKKTISNFDKK
ncbi:MAG: penicillin-binding transpeptidase domain-containing protein, partial [Candidatus Paceibacterota bacterium]